MTEPSVEMLENVPETFELPVCEKPLVSIVIPVYNQYAYTHVCVYSILKKTSAYIPYEVIILDDCSTDETQTIKERIKNIQVYRNQTNQGFLKNCNTYIPKARGKYVFLLNNDTEVTDGWLEPVINALKEPIGLITSCVLNIDGTIQAAGWMISNTGKNCPNYMGISPVFLKNRAFEVSLAYGCAMCFEKAVWEELNGFDEFFMPAYCEESDFSMRVTYQLKKKVVCLGDSKVFHYGSVSYSATSGAENGAELFRDHWKKFCDRWQKEIVSDGMSEEKIKEYLENIIQ